MTVGWWTVDHCRSLEQMASTAPSSSRSIELEFLQRPPPAGWEKHFDLKCGQFFYVNKRTGAQSYRRPALDRLESIKPPSDVDLNLSLATKNTSSTPASTNRRLKRRKTDSLPSTMAISLTSSMSSTSSDITNGGCGTGDGNTSSGREGETRSNTFSSVTVTACKGCLMYVLITRSNPKCPRCGNAAVVEFSTCEQKKLSKRQKPLEIDLNKALQETT